jgi:hypothetical protein
VRGHIVAPHSINLLEWAVDAVSEHCLGRFILVLPLVLITGCAPKLTTEQALVEEAFHVCRSQGPSTTLERVERDGRFTVTGRESESRRVHDCMVRYAEPPKRAMAPGAPPAVAAPPSPAAPPASGPAPPAAGTTAPRVPVPPSAPPVASAPGTARPEPLAAGRLPGTWRGSLKQPARATSEAEAASPATVRFTVAAGTLQWTLTAGAGSPTVAADGTAVVVNGELRMTGTVRAAGPAIGTAPSRSTVTVRYAGTMVGDRLEVTGVTTDRQVHVLSIRRVVE